MKYIKLHSFNDTKAADVYTMAVKFSQQGGVSIDEMRKRVRVLDAIENNKDPVALLLEDADHATLAEALKVVPWSVSTKELLMIIDAALNAGAPPVVVDTTPAA